MNERAPDGRLFGIEIEMLVLHLVRMQRQQHEVAFLPVEAFALDDGIAFALQHVDHQAALVAVLAGLGADLVGEHAPHL